MLNLRTHYDKHSFTIWNTFQLCAAGIQGTTRPARRVHGVSAPASSRLNAAPANAASKARRRSPVFAQWKETKLPAGIGSDDHRVEDSLPDWCADQRNQMTGPADDAELVVKMLNSGAPGVMLDLEDSMANTWSNLM